MREMTGRNVHFEEASLYGLVGSNRDAALDALTNNREFPFAITGGTVVCAGELDAETIAGALQ